MESVVKQSIESYYKDKKVFVTGHTGFKGTWFITWLHLMGAKIKGYSLPPDESNSFFQNYIRKD